MRRVTDHAVLRWIERAKGVDLRPIMAELTATEREWPDRPIIERACRRYPHLGTPDTLRQEILAVAGDKALDVGVAILRHPIGTFIFRDGKIITIYPPNECPSGKSFERMRRRA